MKRLTTCVLLLFCFLLPIVPAWANTEIGIIINKSTNQLGYYQQGQLIKVFPIATGRNSSLTPEGEFKVVRKLVKPYYTKKKIKGGSPQNPLGLRWLGLSVGKTNGSEYGIHGTNNPKSIGTYASSGCIRMHNRDVIWLYEHTPFNTQVKIGRWSKLPERAIFTEPIRLMVGTTPITSKQPALSINGKVWVALKETALALSYQVSWDTTIRQVTISGPTHQFTVNPETDFVMVDQQTYPSPVIVCEQRTYVTLEFVQQFLQAKVTQDNSKIIITKELSLP